MGRPTIITEANFTAAQLLEAARAHGLEAHYVVPRPGWRSKIILASIVDVRAPGIAERLVEMNANGELLELGIVLSRVDAAEIMPTERRRLLDLGAFGHRGTRFDCLSIRGEDLL